jgi:hypothetical protein
MLGIGGGALLRARSASSQLTVVNYVILGGAALLLLLAVYGLIRDRRGPASSTQPAAGSPRQREDQGRRDEQQDG